MEQNAVPMHSPSLCNSNSLWLALEGEQANADNTSMQILNKDFGTYRKHFPLYCLFFS